MDHPQTARNSPKGHGKGPMDQFRQRKITIWTDSQGSLVTNQQGALSGTHFGMSPGIAHARGDRRRHKGETYYPIHVGFYADHQTWSWRCSSPSFVGHRFPCNNCVSRPRWKLLLFPQGATHHHSKSQLEKLYQRRFLSNLLYWSQNHFNNTSDQAIRIAIIPDTTRVKQDEPVCPIALNSSFEHTWLKKGRSLEQLCTASTISDQDSPPVTELMETLKGDRRSPDWSTPIPGQQELLHRRLSVKSRKTTSWDALYRVKRSLHAEDRTPARAPHTTWQYFCIQ